MHARVRIALATVAAAGLTGGLLTVAAGTASAAGSGLQGDFNGDGYRDIAVSAPLAAVGGKSRAGQIAVMYGSPSGLRTAGRTLISQNSAGVPGSAETNDFFGTSTAAGDFNGDGYADLAVGAPGEDVGSDTDGGAVTIVWGSAAGLAGGTTVADPSPSGQDSFGKSLAAGDFDPDGKTDLASGGTSAKVWVFRGGFTKAGGNGGRYYATARIVKGTDAGALHLATGDFNGGGGDDLIVGGYDADTNFSTNVLIYASPTGTKLEDGSQEDLAAGMISDTGDLNGDGKDDVVIGETWDDGIPGAVKGGKIGVVYGNDYSSYTVHSIGQDTAGVPSAAETDDRFGWEVSVGDINGDGYADVAVSAPAENLTTTGASVGDTGAVTVLYGSASGVTAAGSQYFHQDTAGIPGGNEKSDYFGGEVFLSDVNGDKKADLTIGANGENDWNGNVVGLLSDGTAIGTTGVVSFGPSTVGVSTSGYPEFGSVMAG
ncbi:FG-GAP-like repeat-containing protein [Streptomyces sp. NBC_00289]|uniref:FG-GAP-like repeat-containing protein n=1 Tax=Streptomyces sp. NBC_00289 TaxID=2975703 RepID=UPI0032432E1D